MQKAPNPHDPGQHRPAPGLLCKNITQGNINPFPSAIRAWVERQYFTCTLPHHRSWDPKLWSKPYNEILDFLEARLETTLDETEYYGLMVYLRKVIPDNDLYIPFKGSPQYVREILGKCIPIKGNVLFPSRSIAKTRQYMPVKGVKKYART